MKQENVTYLTLIDILKTNYKLVIPFSFSIFLFLSVLRIPTNSRLLMHLITHKDTKPVKKPLDK